MRAAVSVAAFFPDVDDGMGGVNERGRSLRGATLGVPFSGEEVVRAVGREAFKKINERRKAGVAFALSSSLPLRRKSSFARWYA